MSRSLRAVGLLAVVAAALARCAVALAASPSPSPSLSPGASLRRAAADEIVVSGRVVVPPGQAAGEIIVLRGRVQVAGVAREDVVVLSGSVVVTGQVAGSVVALDGDVTLGPTAQIGGDVLASGTVSVASGARVVGSVRQGVRFTLRGRLSAVAGLLSWLAVTVSTLLLGLLLLWVTPRAAEGVDRTLRATPWAAIGWGVVVVLTLPVVALGLVVSVLGIPLGLAVIFGLALLLSIGYALCALALGRALLKPPRSRTLAFLAGWATVRVVGLVPIVSGITWAAAATVGVGGIAVAVWRARGAGRPGKHRLGYAVLSHDRLAAAEKASGASATAEPLGGPEIV